MNQNQIVIELEEFVRNSSIGKSRHFRAATRHTALNSWIGVPAVLINIALGSVLFSFLGEAIPEVASWTAAFLALIAALLTGIQTFFNFSRMFEDHRRIANRYLLMTKEAQYLLAKFKDGLIELPEIAKCFETLNDRYQQINLDAEPYPTGSRDFQWALRQEELRLKGLSSRRGQRKDATPFK